jgi:hypothetical protein
MSAAVPALPANPSAQQVRVVCLAAAIEHRSVSQLPEPGVDEEIAARLRQVILDDAAAYATFITTGAIPDPAWVEQLTEQSKALMAQPARGGSIGCWPPATTADPDV